MNNNSLVFPDDMFRGEPGHPMCCFFEVLASSADPDEIYYGEFFCHMVLDKTPAKVCKGDYIICPLQKKASQY